MQSHTYRHIPTWMTWVYNNANDFICNFTYPVFIQIIYIMNSMQDKLNGYLQCVPSSSPQRPWIQMCLLFLVSEANFLSGMQVVAVELWNHKSGPLNVHLNISFAIRDNCAQNPQSLVGHNFQCGIANSIRQHHTMNITIKPSYVPFSSPTWRHKSMAMILPTTRMYPLVSQDFQ